jgi:predicted transcriptional regulator
LHLVDGHLGSVAVDELNKAAALSRWDLDVGDLPKALEEGAKFVLGDIAREAADKDGGVVRVGELVHLAAGVEPSAGAGSATSIGEAAHAATPHLLLGHAARHHRVAVVAMTGEGVVVVASCALVARSQSDMRNQ